MNDSYQVPSALYLLVTIASLPSNTIGRFKTLIEELANVTQLQVDQVRVLLRCC